jgi:hypothetical protein
MEPEVNHSKGEVLMRFLEQVSSEIAALTASARAAHQAATHEESKAEDRHDTFAIEASYLAAGQSARVMELEKVQERAIWWCREACFPMSRTVRFTGC